MSPVAAALNTLTRAIGSFHPTSMPRLARVHYQRELVAWSLLPVMTGALEGGVVAVLAKNAFAGAVLEPRLNLAVAVLTGAPAFANVTSFLWAALSHGRNKIRFLTGLQLATVVLVASIALAPFSDAGLVMLMLAAVGARICWSGVVTIRSTVWHANYPRHARATMAGKLATVQSIVMATIGFIIGWAMRTDVDAFRLLYPLAAVFGLAGVVIYARMRMRGHRALINAERTGGDSQRSLVNPFKLRHILIEDDRYRRYMTCMFVFGTGNIMVGAPLVIMLRDRFHLDTFASVLIAATIPVIIMPVTIPLWSRLLDRVHIVRFRAVHSWAFVSSIACFLAGCVLMQPALLVAGAAAKGVAFGGGVLGWNLGHHDFAPPEKVSQYMGVHVTL
ncbi:MAG: MFS transporter, partial [Planctomycetota bacterium]